MAVGLMSSIFLQVILETLILLNDLCHSQGYTTNALEARSKQRVREKKMVLKILQRHSNLLHSKWRAAVRFAAKNITMVIYIGQFNKGSLLSAVGQVQGLILFS